MSGTRSRRDSAALATTPGARDLLAWLNTTLDSSFVTITDLQTGVAQCQILDLLLLDNSLLCKVNFLASNNDEYLENLRVFVSMAQEVGASRVLTFDIHRIAAGSVSANLSCAQYLKTFFTAATCSSVLEVTAPQRRSVAESLKSAVPLPASSSQPPKAASVQVFTPSPSPAAADTSASRSPPTPARRASVTSDPEYKKLQELLQMERAANLALEKEKLSLQEQVVGLLTAEPTPPLPCRECTTRASRPPSPPPPCVECDERRRHPPVCQACVARESERAERSPCGQCDGLRTRVLEMGQQVEGLNALLRRQETACDHLKSEVSDLQQQLQTSRRRCAELEKSQSHSSGASKSECRLIEAQLKELDALHTSYGLLCDRLGATIKEPRSRSSKCDGQCVEAIEGLKLEVEQLKADKDRLSKTRRLSRLPTPIQDPPPPPPTQEPTTGKCDGLCKEALAGLQLEVDQLKADKERLSKTRRLSRVSSAPPPEQQDTKIRGELEARCREQEAIIQETLEWVKMLKSLRDSDQETIAALELELQRVQTAQPGHSATTGCDGECKEVIAELRLEIDQAKAQSQQLQKSRRLSRVAPSQASPISSPVPVTRKCDGSCVAPLVKLLTDAEASIGTLEHSVRGVLTKSSPAAMVDESELLFARRQISALQEQLAVASRAAEKENALALAQAQSLEQAKKVNSFWCSYVEGFEKQLCEAEKRAKRAMAAKLRAGPARANCDSASPKLEMKHALRAKERELRQEFGVLEKQWMAQCKEAEAALAQFKANCSCHGFGSSAPSQSTSASLASTPSLAEVPDSVAAAYAALVDSDEFLGSVEQLLAQQTAKLTGSERQRRQCESQLRDALGCLEASLSAMDAVDADVRHRLAVQRQARSSAQPTQAPSADTVPISEALDWLHLVIQASQHTTASLPAPSSHSFPPASATSGPPTPATETAVGVDGDERPPSPEPHAKPLQQQQQPSAILSFFGFGKKKDAEALAAATPTQPDTASAHAPPPPPPPPLEANSSDTHEPTTAATDESSTSRQSSSLATPAAAAAPSTQHDDDDDDDDDPPPPPPIEDGTPPPPPAPPVPADAPPPPPATQARPVEDASAAADEPAAAAAVAAVTTKEAHAPAAPAEEAQALPQEAQATAAAAAAEKEEAVQAAPTSKLRGFFSRKKKEEPTTSNAPPSSWSAFLRRGSTTAATTTATTTTATSTTAAAAAATSPSAPTSPDASTTATTAAPSSSILPNLLRRATGAPAAPEAATTPTVTPATANDDAPRPTATATTDSGTTDDAPPLTATANTTASATTSPDAAPTSTASLTAAAATPDTVAPAPDGDVGVREPTHGSDEESAQAQQEESSSAVAGEGAPAIDAEHGCVPAGGGDGEQEGESREVERNGIRQVDEGGGQEGGDESDDSLEQQHGRGSSPTPTPTGTTAEQHRRSTHSEDDDDHHSHDSSHDHHDHHDNHDKHQDNGSNDDDDDGTHNDSDGANGDHEGTEPTRTSGGKPPTAAGGGSVKAWYSRMKSGAGGPSGHLPLSVANGSDMSADEQTAQRAAAAAAAAAKNTGGGFFSRLKFSSSAE